MSSSNPSVAGKRQLKVLVVDDNKDNAQLLSMIIKLKGHQTLSVYDGKSALDAVSEYKPDVVMMDLSMPDMSGFEVCCAIRQSELGKSIHVIAQSGWETDAYRQQAQEAGFDDYLLKPVAMDELQSVLEAIANR